MLGFLEALERCPLVAILRGIEPAESVAIGTALVEAGFTIVEVPLNSPRPLESIAHLAESLGDRALIGAGTVRRASEAEAVAAAGGRLIVAPNTDPVVIATTKRLGMIAIPGFGTATEAMAALDAGADGLKMFPAELLTPTALRAFRTVLPAQSAILPVGGISVETMAAYWRAGATGFGVGSALYRAGASAAQVRTNAEALLAALAAVRGDGETMDEARILRDAGAGEGSGLRSSR